MGWGGGAGRRGGHGVGWGVGGAVRGGAGQPCRGPGPGQGGVGKGGGLGGGGVFAWKRWHKTTHSIPAPPSKLLHPPAPPPRPEWGGWVQWVVTPPPTPCPAPPYAPPNPTLAAGSSAPPFPGRGGGARGAGKEPKNDPLHPSGPGAGGRGERRGEERGGAEGGGKAANPEYLVLNSSRV